MKPGSTTSATRLAKSCDQPSGANASGLDRVELWVKAPGATSYSKAATSTSGSFSYTAAADGSYRIVVPSDRVKGQTVTLTARYIGYTPVRRPVTLTPTAFGCTPWDRESPRAR